MKALGVLGFVVGLLTACGDNSKQCGPGTVDKDGVCEPDRGGLICGDGTVLDELTDECVPDPSVCGGGTVLIDGTCRDPLDDLPIDLMEGPEPNGFEGDATPAGTITLKDVGEAFVIKGCVTPTDNNTPDFDVYHFDVTGPTLLHIAADGIEGLAAGFLVVGDDPRLRSWLRLGLNISTDTSKREVFLPVAGHYQLILTDTRTLLPLTNNGEGLPAAGNPDGTSCYFVTINQRIFPTPATLSLTQPTTGTIGEDLKFFTASFQNGLNTMTAVVDPEDLDGDGLPDLDGLGNPIDSRAAASIVLLDNDELRQIRDADASSPEIGTIFGGIDPTDSPLLVLDYVWNYAVLPADYRIEMLDQTSSQALVDGTAVAATSHGQFFSENGQAVFDNVNLFHFDVAAGGEVDTMDIAFSIPVQGSIVDQDGLFVSPLTGLTSSIGGVPVVETFTAYRGLFRPFAPGRHYFFVFAPRDPVGTPFTVTSTIEAVTPTTIVRDTPSAPTAFNSVLSNPFRYAGGAEPWHTFDATADASTGPVEVQLFDPAVTTPQTPGFAFGRLDPLTTTRDSDPPSVRIGDGTPLLQPTFPTDGSGPLHQILRNPFAALPPAATTFLVKVTPTIANPTGNFVMDFSTRAYDDLGGPLMAGDTRSITKTLAAGAEERFFLATTPGHRVVITLPSPSDADFVIEPLLPDESAIDTVTTIDRTLDLSGYVAFRVRGVTPVTTGDFTVDISVQANGYTVTQTPATSTDACAGGSPVALAPDTSGNPGDDEGLSAPLAPPTGFTLGGASVGNFVVSSNGFLTFDLATTEAQLDNLPLAASTVAIAPFWDDLGAVSVCKKTLPGGELVIQWDGFSFDTFEPVAFQAVLSPDGTIAFVYGPGHFATGETATIGVQGVELGFLTPVTTSDSSITFAPN